MSRAGCSLASPLPDHLPHFEPTGALVESLTSEQIALELKQRGGVTVEPSNIVMPEVTELGAFTADVTLHPDVSVGIKVVVEKSKITFT